MIELPPSEGLTLAEPWREQAARSIFGSEEITAEEWVARYADGVGCSAFDQYRYSDAALQEKVFRIHQLLRSPGEVERCRRQFLTPEELEAAHRRDKEPF